MLSCQTSEVLSDKEGSGVELPVENASEFTLVSDELIEESEALELRNVSYTSNYEQSIPIYRYYYHSGDKSDHYFGTEQSSGASRTIKNRVYPYEAQEFNLEKYSNSYTRPLYRYYSSNLNDHALSSSSVSGYTQDGEILGYIFISQEMGTVPLKEYYNAVKKNRLYVVRDSEVQYIAANEPDNKYVRTLGYVYPGARNFSGQTPSSITIKYTGNSAHFKAQLNIRVREVDNVYRNLIYTGDFKAINGETFNVTLPSNYKIVSTNLVITNYISGSQVLNTFYNLSRPGFPFNCCGEYMQTVADAYFIKLSKDLNGYNTTFNISYSY